MNEMERTDHVHRRKLEYDPKKMKGNECFKEEMVSNIAEIK